MRARKVYIEYDRDQLTPDEIQKDYKNIYSDKNFFKIVEDQELADIIVIDIDRAKFNQSIRRINNPLLEEFAVPNVCKAIVIVTRKTESEFRDCSLYNSIESFCEVPDPFILSVDKLEQYLKWLIITTPFYSCPKEYNEIFKEIIAEQKNKISQLSQSKGT